MKTADSRLEDFARIELCNLVIGEKLGSGCYRDVYAHALDPNIVVKIEMRRGSFANILEWEFWQHNQFLEPIAMLLAPCLHISDSGLVLIQRRTYPITDKKKLPRKVPRLLTDIAESNWGHLETQFGPVVCHDYGCLRLSGDPKDKANLREVVWSALCPLATSAAASIAAAAMAVGNFNPALQYFS